MAGLDKRLEKLEARISPKGSVTYDQAGSVTVDQALADYFAALWGEEVPERANPELDAYFAELAEYERQKGGRSWGA